MSVKNGVHQCFEIDAYPFDSLNYEEVYHWDVVVKAEKFNLDLELEVEDFARFDVHDSLYPTVYGSILAEVSKRFCPEKSPPEHLDVKIHFHDHRRKLVEDIPKDHISRFKDFENEYFQLGFIARVDAKEDHFWAGEFDYVNGRLPATTPMRFAQRFESGATDMEIISAVAKEYVADEGQICPIVQVAENSYEINLTVDGLNIGGDQDASEVEVDTTGFDGNLATTDDTVQSKRFS